MEGAASRTEGLQRGQRNKTNGSWILRQLLHVLIWLMNILSYLFNGRVQRMNVTALNHSSEDEQAGRDGRAPVQTVTRSKKLLTKDQLYLCF